MEIIFSIVFFAIIFGGLALLCPTDDRMDPVSRLDPRLLLMHHN